MQVEMQMEKQSDTYQDSLQFEYLMNWYNFREFEKLVCSGEELYNAGCNEGDFFSLLFKMESILNRVLTDKEYLEFSNFVRDYTNFIDNIFDNVIYDIKYNEERPEYKEDCIDILYEYLGRFPNTFEVEILWNSEGKWYDDNDSVDSIS